MRFAVLHKTGAPAPRPSAQGITVHENARVLAGAAAVRIQFTEDGPKQRPITASDVSPSITGLSIVDADSRQAAIDWLRGTPVGDADAEFEIRETGCPGGLPGVEAASATAACRPRFLVLVKADANTEADAPTAAALLDAMALRNDEGVKTGLLLAADGLKSTARGTRVKFSGGRTSVMDGPFAEAKELVAGFWLIQAESLDEAIAWVHRYPYAQQRPEIEIHPVAV